MKNIFISTTAFLLIATATPSFSAGMDMPMSAEKSGTPAYRFELAGPVKSMGKGKSLVTIRLMHDSKPVMGAIIIQSRADMGPMGMASMTAPINAVGEKPPGTYLFEIANGPVWNKPDNWAVSVSAKVQGVTQTVTGSVTVKLSP